MIFTRPVADIRPWIPPCEMGFPVTHPGADIFPCPKDKTEILSEDIIGHREIFRDFLEASGNHQVLSMPPGKLELGKKK